MAFPTVRASRSGSMISERLYVDVSLPVGHEEGDLLIIGISLDGSRTITAPAGWTQLANPTNTTANRFPIWYKVRGSTETDPVRLDWSTTSEMGTVFSVAITAGTWSGIPEVATSYSSSSSPNAPLLTPSWGSMDTLWLALHGWDYNRTSSSSPSGFTLMTYSAGYDTMTAGHRTFYKQDAVATVDPGLFSISAADTWYAHTVAIAPSLANTKVGLTITGQTIISDSMFVNIGGVWKTVEQVLVNIGGVWKESATPLPPPKTATPTISNVSHSGTTIYWAVTNNATSSATVYTEIGDSTPDLYTSNIAGGGERPFSHDMGVLPFSVTIYATAQVSGEEISNYTSYTYYP